jgi:hypothetical protein
LPASLVTVAINHIVAITVAITVAIALVAINHLPHSLPLLLLPKALLSLSHSTLVTNTISRFIPLALFVTRNPYRNRLKKHSTNIVTAELYNHVFEHENEHFHLLPSILSPHTSYLLIAISRG